MRKGSKSLKYRLSNPSRTVSGSSPALTANLNLKLMGKYIIQDWMGNHLFKNHTFTSFEEGWDFISENIKEEYEDDGTYDDYYVIEI